MTTSSRMARSFVVALALALPAGCRRADGSASQRRLIEWQLWLVRVPARPVPAHRNHQVRARPAPRPRVAPTLRLHRAGSRRGIARPRLGRAVAARRTAPLPGGVVSRPAGISTGGGATAVGAAASRRRRVRVRRVVPETAARCPGRRFHASSTATRSSFPFYGPWGSYYPWFGSGFGYGLGYVTYNPWRYGATAWIWGRYGMWYDPFAYAFAYDPFWYGGYGGGGGSYEIADEERAPERRTGSVRLRAEPKDSQGLHRRRAGRHRRRVRRPDRPPGARCRAHELELRAEGYLTYTGTLNVPAGKTVTERVKLKKVDR